MSSLNDVCMYFTDTYEPCNFTDENAMWLTNFAVGGLIVDIFRVDGLRPFIVDCVTLSEPVIRVEQLQDAVREHDGTSDNYDEEIV